MVGGPLGTFEGKSVGICDSVGLGVTLGDRLGVNDCEGCGDVDGTGVGVTVRDGP